ncbi:MAG: PA2779 family protein [Hylemonella sp.]|nr:PA2779 family protein [Hylemonella sp.]
MKTIKRLISSLLIVSMSLAGLPISAQAGIVSTEEVISTEAAAANLDRVSSFLARQDVQQALQEQGISAQAAVDRVKAMSDEEVAALAGRVDQAPAGGSVLGILFAVFVILLVTDILGLTKVFPFTRAAR